MIDNQLLIAFLDKVHLFSGLDHTQLGGIAPKLVEKDYPAGAVIIKRGEKADGFYMVYKGKVKVTIPHPEKGERQLAWLAPGDYFGEEALFENRERSANISALEDCQLLFLSRDNFNDLITRYEKLKPNFKVAIKSHKLARATHFKWMGKNEVIYFIARRHKLLLYRALIAPVLSLIIPALLIAWGFLTGAVTPMAVGIIVLVIILGWGVWNAVDWSNDYYIVTNQRVVWLEKVVGLYDSREEAPLGTILSVGVETDMLGRVFDFGNVIVRTFVGKLEFDHVDHPVQAADMIREYWERTKAITNRSQMDVMKDTIKQKLGLPVEKRKQPELSPIVTADEEKLAKTPMWMLAMQNLFQLRIEDGGKVIYRKHWVILLQQGWKPFLLFIAGIVAIIWRIVVLVLSDELSFIRTNAAGTISPDTIAVSIPLLLLPVLFWMWYEYTDWKNDTFMVTNDEIFDIDRKPFGQEERRSAQIDSILSTSYKRAGFIAYIFNYGTVSISVGGTSMAFEDVMDPAAVQADINRRRSARIAKKNEDAGKDDRERFATWLAAYHQNQNEFIVPVDPAKGQPNSPATPGQKEFSTGEREAFSSAAADGGLDGDADFGTGGLDGDGDFQAGE